jgi:hypothetical protein
MKNEQGNYDGFSENDQAKSPNDSAREATIIVAIIAVVTVILGILAESIFTTQQIYVIRPMLAAGAVFIIFSYVLRFRVRTHLFGEIGFIYMVFSLAYTILPAIKFLMIDFNFPLDFDGLNFAVLSPQPADLGTHFWRHVLFISGVGAGFLAVRSRPLKLKPLNEKPTGRYGPIIAIMIALIGCCMCAVTLLSAPVTTYIEHYIRFDHLSWPLRRLVTLCLIFKSGGYFVLLALMFSQYRKYRMLIFSLVPIVCAYEVIYSLGSRIVAFTILMAFFGFYHFRVSPITLRKGIVVLIVLAFVFIGIEIVRSSDYDLDDAFYHGVKQKQVVASEFEAVYCTGFHLYVERSQKTLPPRDWEMFIYEFISVIPFIDHTKYHPQYWYARNYFPEAIVPPTTMGVIADSAIWGGEFDLLVRSLINGAVFALLTRWFLRRREKMWTLTIYIYCIAMCILTIKYSVFNLLMPLLHVLLPTLLLTEVLIQLERIPVRLKSVHIGTSG